MDTRYRFSGDGDELPIERIRITFQETKGSLREARLALRDLEHLLQVLSLERLEVDGTLHHSERGGIPPWEHESSRRPQYDPEAARFVEESVDEIDAKLSMQSPLVVEVEVAASAAGLALSSIWSQVLRLAVRTDEARNQFARG